MIETSGRARSGRPSSTTALRWSLFVLTLLSLFFATEGRRDAVRVRSTAREVYEEVIEDRYNLMDINDPIYESVDTDIASSSTAAESKFHLQAGPGLPVHHANLPDSEMNALQDLYLSTGGPQWNWFSFNASGQPWFFNSSSSPCTQRWQGVLCTQVPSNGFYHVIGMDLNLHDMKGRIPLSLFNLTMLRGINLASNDLYGEFPSEVVRWTQLKVLDFSNNIIYGNIPTALCDLPAIEAIYLYNNYLNGSLPACLGRLNTLRVLKFTLNELTGKIPASLGNLSSVQLLYLGRNFLTGSIPAALGNLSLVTTFLLYENDFTGHLSPALASLQNVVNFNVDLNRLSGTIPTFLANLSHCTLLYLNDNHFTGTIPVVFAHAPVLQNFYLENNLLTGTIPAELSKLSTLLSLELSGNKLEGTIPAILSTLPLLQILQLSGNHLTGTIPSELCTMHTLQTLELAQNDLHGTIPDTIGGLYNLSNFYIYENNIHGPVPESIGNMSGMIYLYLYINLLSGPLPTTLAQLPILTSFFVQDNHISGTLDSVFSPLRQPFLSLIQVSGNQFTGTLPDSVFALPSLQTFIAVSNCFQGSLPVSMCSCTTLKTLGLDGIRAASACQKLFLPGISSSYVLTQKIDNGIPTCLFSMPELNTLHLSGNDLTGTLPHNLNISNRLMDVALSHNKLKGAIPKQIQERVWYNLDLSFNKFSGVLSESFGTVGGNHTFGTNFVNAPRNFSKTWFINQTTLSLRNNRLSHVVPRTILDRENITILQGNLFSCELDESDLPEHDHGKETYQCGSNSFNISYYFWLGATTVLLLSVFMVYYWRQLLEPYIKDVFTMITYLKRWFYIVTWYDQESYNYRSKSRLHHYKYVIMVSEAVLHFSTYTTLFILLVSLPLYSAISEYYGTHTYEYAWTVSAAFLSGYPALIILLLFFAVLIAVLLVLFRYAFRRLRQFLHELPEDIHFSVLDNFEEEEAVEQNENKYSSNTEKFAIYVAFFLINVIVVVSVNVGYVYVAIYENSRYFIAAQIALSIFKLGWNNMGSVYLIRWTHHYLASSATKDWKTKGAGFFAIQLFVSLFNYIAIPCLVVAVISPNCFNSIVKGAPSVDSHYYYEACGLFSVHFGCIINEPQIGSTTYNPPFTYSYECSSSLITYYAPTFIYLCIITTFLNPLLEVAMQQAHHRATPGTWWHGQMEYWVPPNLQTISAERDATKAPYDIFNPYFDANLLLVTIITYFGVLLTFGLVFPPLSIAMLVSIFVVVYTSKLEMGRFISNAIDQNLHKYLDRVEEECHGVGSIPKLRQCVRMLIIFSCLFYTPFLFDTLGDSQGLEGALWILLLLPSIPLLLYVGHLLYIYVNKQYSEDGRGDNSISIELRKSEFFRSQKAGELLESAIEMETMDHKGGSNGSSGGVVSGSSSGGESGVSGNEGVNGVGGADGSTVSERASEYAVTTNSRRGSKKTSKNNKNSRQSDARGAEEVDENATFNVLQQTV